MNSSKTHALSLLLLLGFIWGTGYSIARFAIINGVSPLGYSFWQSLGPAILITIIILMSRKTIYFNSLHLRYYLICGLTGIVIPNTNMYFAAVHLPAGLLAVIVNIVPIIAYPMALIARVEQYHWLRFSGVMSAISGVMLIILPKANLSVSHLELWVLMSLITPFSFAFCSVYISRFRPPNSHCSSLAAGTLLASTILLIPIVYLSGNFYSLHFPLYRADKVILLEIILSSMGYILFFQLIKIAGAVFYSLVDTIVALTGLFWGYFIFNETVTPSIGAAVFLILIGLILNTQYQHKFVGWIRRFLP